MVSLAPARASCFLKLNLKTQGFLLLLLFEMLIFQLVLISCGYLCQGQPDGLQIKELCTDMT